MSPTNVTLLIFGLFFGAIIVLSLTKSVYLPYRLISLFRALFPSWRFFEELTEIPILHYRLGFGEAELGDWQPALIRPEPKITSVFLNSSGNLYLACQTLLQQLEHDIGELGAKPRDGFVNSVSYRLTRSLVLFQIRQRAGERLPNTFQFKVSRLLPGASEQSTETFLVSEVELFPDA